MTNNTTEYWELDGVSLHKLGWSVSTKTGRYAPPPLRGDNVRAAFAPGEMWVPKIPDARNLRLSMWMTGTDPDTGIPTGDPRLAWNDNWAALMDLFWDPDRQFTLTRRWWRSTPGGPQILEAFALGQLVPGTTIDPSMAGGPHRSTFDVDIRLAHPFFYGPLVTTHINPGQSVDIVNGGDWFAYSKSLAIDLIGPLGNPRITNTSTTPNSVYCGLSNTGAVAAVQLGETLTLDIPNWIALSTTGASTTRTNRSGDIYNSGTRPWFLLARGTNRITLTATGIGHAVIRHRAPYL